ncbi:MAG: rsmA, partial [Chlamydiia bacterium]|nr:rsmA [Chlamydiia bacterium]
PKKSLSQNFLIDGNIVKKISLLADVREGDFVLEIGPGPGVLTEHLLELGCHIIAVERDELFAEMLPRLQGKMGTLEVFCADILKFDIQEHLRKRLPPGVKAKVISNIPYHLTAPIIEKIVDSSDVLYSATLMVQDEVARRCVAKVPSPDYSSFSLFLQYHAAVQYGFLVPPKCFYPAPNVDSAVIRFDLQKRFSVQKEKEFLAVVRLAFNQRRKMIRATLRDLYKAEIVESSLESLAKNPKARPEELSIESWVALFECLEKHATLS